MDTETPRPAAAEAELTARQQEAARLIMAEYGRVMGKLDAVIDEGTRLAWRPGEGGEPAVGAGTRRAAGPLRPLGTRDVMGLEAPARHPPLAPVLVDCGLTLVHGPHGIGLSHVATGCAAAIATAGSFIDWRAPHARRVLLISGSIPSRMLAARIRAALATVQGRKTPDDRLLVLAPDCQDSPMPTLDSALGQQQIQPLVAACDVVIIDDVALLVPSIAANASLNRWRFAELLRKLRRQGKSILLAQHSGRDASGRAVQATLECIAAHADVVVGLRRPADYQISDGARFEVHIERAAHLPGSARLAQEVRLHGTEGRTAWSARDAAEASRRMFLTLIEEGMSSAEAGRELGLTRMTAWRWGRTCEPKPFLYHPASLGSDGERRGRQVFRWLGRTAD